MSPVPVENCDGPGKRTVFMRSADSGLIQAVIVPSPVSAWTVFVIRVKQMLPPLVSTSMGPATEITRIPPPPVCA